MTEPGLYSVPRSPGLATDLELLRLQGSVIEPRPGYLVVRTPANPTFHWGNTLILAAAPEPGSLAEVVELFTREHPEAAHVAIGVDDPAPGLDAAEAERLGLAVESDVVLTASTLARCPSPDGYRLAEVDPGDDAAWAALVALDLSDLDPDADDAAREGMAVFRARRYAGFRGLVAAGRGAWWAAYLPDGTPVAGLGVFDLGDGLARYQDVLTHPDHRRRGLAAALVARAGRARLAAGARTLVIVADPDGPAIGVYRRSGLTDTTRQWALYRPPSSP